VRVNSGNRRLGLGERLLQGGDILVQEELMVYKNV
jgi:hypothetical protein